MKALTRKTVARVVIALLSALILVLILIDPRIQTVGRAAYENVALALRPSAERAFAYGEYRFNFNAKDPYAYDLDRAEYFFLKTLEMDPLYPYVHHELARVAFLRGDFLTALGRINIEVERYGDIEPNTYYVRGLIEGFMERYEASAKDYETYLKTDHTNWAALNDYAWVLLKAGRIRDAAEATEYGLYYFPENPWLLNSNAIARYELGDVERALEQALHAQKSVETITESDWLKAYPGNDPRVAQEGVTALKDSIANNIHMMSSQYETSELQ